MQPNSNRQTQLLARPFLSCNNIQHIENIHSLRNWGSTQIFRCDFFGEQKIARRLSLVACSKDEMALEESMFVQSAPPKGGNYFRNDRLQIVNGSHTLEDLMKKDKWYLYENFTTLADYLLWLPKNEEGAKLIEGLIAKYLQYLREIHRRGFCHGRLDWEFSLVITAGGQPKFGNFTGSKGSVEGDINSQQIGDLKTLQRVLIAALNPYYGMIDKRVIRLVGSYLYNVSINGSSHLDYIQHHPCFMDAGDRINFYLRMDTKIKENPHSKGRINSIMEQLEGTSYGGGTQTVNRDWTQIVPSELQFSLEFNSSTHKTITGEEVKILAYDRTPVSFVHFGRNVGEHPNGIPKEELVEKLEQIKPDFMSNLHRTLIHLKVLTYN